MKKLVLLPIFFMVKKIAIGIFVLLILNNMAFAIDNATIDAIAAHSWEGHRSDFPKITTERDFAAYIKDLIADNKTVKKNLSGGREAFWRTPVVVVADPNNSTNKGTCFKPGIGKKYYDILEE
jgi:hypothetical protein